MEKRSAIVFTKRTLSSLFVLLLFCILSSLILLVMKNVIGDFYRILAREFPDSIPLYNQVTEKAEYLRVEGILYAVAAFPALFIAAYLSVLFHSGKRHLLFNETQGLIRFRDGCKYYAKRFIFADALAVILATVVLVTLVSFIPGLGSMSASIYEPGIMPLLRFCVLPVAAIFAELGAPLTYIFVFLTLLCGSLSSIPHSVLHYRGDALAHSLE